MSNLEAFITGLSNSINGYLQNQNQNKQQMGLLQKKTELETQQIKDVATFKQEMEGDMSPEMGQNLFNQVSPEFGQAAFNALSQFKQQNGRNMTVQEANQTLDPVMKALQGKNDGDNQKELNRQQRIDNQILTFSEKLKSNPYIKQMRQSNISLDQVNRLADEAMKGNTIASASMAARMARAMEGGGVLTDQDLPRYVESKQIVQGTADKLSKLMQGKPTNLTTNEIKEISRVITSAYNEKIQDEVDDYVVRLSENYHMSPEEAAKKLNVEYGGLVRGKRKEKEIKPSKGDSLGLGI